MLVAPTSYRVQCSSRLLIAACGKGFSSAILGDMIGRRTSLGLCGSQVPYMVYNGDRLLLLQ